MRSLRRIAFAAITLLALAACGGPSEPIWSSDEVVKQARYFHDGPPMITLFTVVSTRNGSGGHSGLLINADERIIFDPAGTFQLPITPERNDVHFGMSERAVKVYIDYHARETYDVHVQEFPVSLEAARIASSLAKDYGAVPKAQCSLSITRILKEVPGFEGIRVTYFPNSLSRQFEDITGVAPTIITDDDADKNHNVLFEEPQGFFAG